MNAGIYGGIAWLEIERQRKERVRAERSRRDSEICDDCPLFNKTSLRKFCCGEQKDTE